ncbi:MAG: sigma-70 family RNA polymerase sigma factor [Candidatus Dadabacteria bacterium]|nr:sigma-70 family RNA polymerase sigma factor [Candidatus Dadabacteria bacterium]
MLKSLDISQKFYNDLRSFIKTKISNPQDANDILQDSLLKAQKNIHLLNDDSRFNSCLYQIIRNSIIDFYRNQRIHFSIDELNLKDEHKEIEKNDNKQVTKCLKPLIKTLPEKYREAMELTELGDMNQEELSNNLSLTISGTKSRVQLARKKIKKCIFRML